MAQLRRWWWFVRQITLWIGSGAQQEAPGGVLRGVANQFGSTTVTQQGVQFHGRPVTSLP